MAYTNSKGRRPVTLSLNSKLWEQYSTYCIEHGMAFSRRMEILIERDLERIANENKEGL